MDQITSAQLAALAQQFQAMGSAILNYRETTALSDELDTQLETIQNDLLNKSGDLARMAAIQVGADAASAVSALSNVSKEMTATIGTIGDVQKVINIAAAALKVVVSVISMNPGNIVDSIGDLATATGIQVNV